MSIFNEFNKKEKPVFTGITRGVGGFGFGKAAAAVGGGAAAVPNVAASGGIIHEYEDSGTKYRCHVFLNPGNFVVTDTDTQSTMDYLVVGGGGGGGGDNGGGGGGGGVYAGSTTIGTLTYAVEVGLGGKGTWTSSNSFNATDGIPSSFVDPSGPTTRTAGGGGGSGGYSGADGRNGLSPGGSGGGGAYSTNGSTGNSDSGAQAGGDGGSGSNSPAEGGGGGGGSGGNAGLTYNACVSIGNGVD